MTSTGITSTGITSTGMTGGRPRLAVWKFASCDGCQLTLLNCEDELLAVAGELDAGLAALQGRQTFHN